MKLRRVPLPEDELESGQALLLVKHGPNAGSTFLIEGDSTSHRTRPEERRVLGRRHGLEEARRAPSRPADGSLHDLGSLNGTYVNRERVEMTTLASGDEIQIGKFKLVFFAGE